MPNTIEQALIYARAHPLRDGSSWHNWCESFVYRAGGFTASFNTATLAGDASGPLNTNRHTAPRGAIHYWGNGDGHVAFELGDGLLLMASDAVTTRVGVDMGTVTFEDYAARRPDMAYRGWTMRHGNERLAVTVVAVETAPKPLPVVHTESEDDVFYYVQSTPAGSKWVVSVITGKRRLIPIPEWRALREAFGNDIKIATLTDAEIKSIPMM